MPDHPKRPGLPLPYTIVHLKASGNYDRAIMFNGVYWFQVATLVEAKEYIDRLNTAWQMGMSKAREIGSEGPVWDSKRDQDALCVCGDAYRMHFDQSEDMRPVQWVLGCTMWKDDTHLANTSKTCRGCNGSGTVYLENPPGMHGKLHAAACPICHPTNPDNVPGVEG